MFDKSFTIVTLNRMTFYGMKQSRMMLTYVAFVGMGT
jgi:hypothetical protein